MNCKTIAGPDAGKVCTSDGVKRVTFRKMPSWGSNASLLLVEICRLRGGEEYLATEGTNGVYLQDFENAQDFLDLPAEECLREFCSEDVEKLSFKLDKAIIPLPIAVGRLELGIAIGFDKSRFELRCKNF
jgi:hypothetical protein